MPTARRGSSGPGTGAAPARGFRRARPAPRAAELPGPSLRFGTHPVEEALRAGIVTRLLLQDELREHARLRALHQLAVAHGVPVEYQDNAQLTLHAASDRHQGAVAEVRPFHYARLADLLAGQRVEDPFFLVLDGVEDPQNLGALLRTADAAGVHGVILPDRHAAPVTPAVARASAGAVDYVAVAQVTNLVRALDDLKAAGVWVYGLDASAAQAYDTADYARPVAIVAGAEGKGLAQLVRRHCDLLVGIPMRGHVASLNVSVATALALFAARRARDGADDAGRTDRA